MIGETIQKAIQLAKDNNMEVLAIKPHTMHSDDYYLVYILLDRKTDTSRYATWSYNSTTNDFNLGHYFENSKDALKDFHKRGDIVQVFDKKFAEYLIEELNDIGCEKLGINQEDYLKNIYK